MVPSSALVPLAEREVELGGGWKEASPPTVLSSLICRGLCGPLIWSQMVLPCGLVPCICVCRAQVPVLT